MRLRRFVFATRRYLLRGYLSLRYRHIWPRLALVLLLSVTVPLALLSFLLITKSRRAVRDSVFLSHAEIASRIATEIDDFIRTPQAVLQSLASQLAVSRPAAWQQESILVNQVLDYPYFLRIVSLTIEGSQVASSDMGFNPPEILPPEAIRADGLPYISGVKDLHGHSPYITLAVPVEAGNGATGILCGDINLRYLWKIIDSISIEKTGSVCIVSRTGEMIAARDKKKVLMRSDLTKSPDVRLALAGKTGTMVVESDGNRWMSSYAPVPSLGWIVLMRQGEAEAMAFSRKMQAQSLFLLLLVELSVVALSVVLARCIAQPMQEIAKRLRDLASGDLTTRFTEKRYDEIGVLFKSFNGMIEKLKRADSMKRFAAVGEASACIAHEFKNSMIALKSFVQLFPEKRDDPEFIAMFGSLVPKEMQRWERMLGELTDLSTIDTMRTRKVLVSSVVDEVLKLLGSDLSARGIGCSFQRLAELPVVADKQRLKQVVMNIVLNAAQALPEGGIIRIIEDVVKKERTFSTQILRLSIRDTGKGIPPDILPSIFEPFQSKKIGSLGLGLFICRRIIENHRGTISVESGADGTVFHIKLPVSRNA